MWLVGYWVRCGAVATDEVRIDESRIAPRLTGGIEGLRLGPRLAARRRPSAGYGPVDARGRRSPNALAAKTAGEEPDGA